MSFTVLYLFSTKSIYINKFLSKCEEIKINGKNVLKFSLQHWVALWSSSAVSTSASSHFVLKELLFLCALDGTALGITSSCRSSSSSSRAMLLWFGTISPGRTASGGVSLLDPIGAVSLVALRLVILLW